VAMARECVNCGIEGVLMCGKCIESAPPIAVHSCAKCAEPAAAHVDLCGDCSELPPPIDRLLPIYRYGGAARNAVRALKYQQITALAPVMAAPMATHPFTLHGRFDCVVPMPKHRDQACDRGYNQAGLLAQNVARSLGLRLLEDGLIKTRATPSQVGLDRRQRAMSLRDAFQAGSGYDFNGAHVLLIDDVATTGSTLMQCAAALKRAQARRVSAIVYAKEMLKTDAERARLQQDESGDNGGHARES